MRQNPRLDRVLPPDAPADLIRHFFETCYSVIPHCQLEHTKAVLLSLKNLPDDIRKAIS